MCKYARAYVGAPPLSFIHVYEKKKNALCIRESSYPWRAFYLIAIFLKLKNFYWLLNVQFTKKKLNGNFIKTFFFFFFMRNYICCDVVPATFLVYVHRPCTCIVLSLFLGDSFKKNVIHFCVVLHLYISWQFVLNLSFFFFFFYTYISPFLTQGTAMSHGLYWYFITSHFRLISFSLHRLFTTSPFHPHRLRNHCPFFFFFPIF